MSYLLFYAPSLGFERLLPYMIAASVVLAALLAFFFSWMEDK